MTKIEKVFAGVSWVPLAAFAGCILFARQYEGWGAWATAGLALIPILLSGVMLFIGIGLAVSAKSAARSPVPAVLAAVLAGSLFLVMAVMFVLR